MTDTKNPKFCYLPVRLAVWYENSFKFVGWVWWQKAHLRYSLHYGWIAFVDDQLNEDLMNPKTCRKVLQQAFLRQQLAEQSIQLTQLVEALQYYAGGEHFYVHERIGHKLFGVAQCNEYGKKASEAIAAYETSKNE